MRRPLPRFIAALLSVMTSLGFAADAMATDAVKVIADPQVCRTLLRSLATAPSGAADYKPGVDVHGDPVVPAEGPGGGNGADWLAEGVTIDLSVDLAARYGLGGPQARYGGDVALGRAVIRNGRVYINDRPLMSEHEAAIRKACQAPTVK